jgi:hypothetical protein
MHHARGRNAQPGACHPGRGRHQVNANLLRYFSEPATLDSEEHAFLQRGMALAMEWATRGLVIPHVSETIDSAVEAINAELQSLKAGRGVPGKVAVIVDRDLAAGRCRVVACFPTVRRIRRAPSASGRVPKPAGLKLDG